MPPKQSKGPKGKQKPQEEQREDALQAVVLADAFETRFRPFSLDHPRCLLPLANTPLIEYTLEFLAGVGVHDVIIYTGAHADQIETYINTSKWKLPSTPFGSLTILKSAATSVGDCMRDLDNRDLITGDFLVVSGDVVTNIDLQSILAKHRARREKDKNAIMTMVLRESGTNSGLRGKDRRPVFILDPRVDRCLHCEEVGRRKRKGKRLTLDPEFLTSHGEIEVREDLTDCRIDICTPDVLAQWTENFDYQSLRKSFLFGVLKDYELNGKTIHTHIINDQYAARVKNLKTYDMISKDIARRWTFPHCPDSNFLHGQSYRLTAEKNYVENDVSLGRTSLVKARSVIGTKTSIGERSVIQNSFLGSHCRIGNNVYIEGSYIWDGVTVEDGSTIHHSIIASDCTIGAKCTINPGSLIASKINVPSSTTTSSALTSTTKDPRKPSSPKVYEAPNSDSDSNASSPRMIPRPRSSTSSISSISTLNSQPSSDGADTDPHADHLHHRRTSSALSNSSLSLELGQSSKAAQVAADATRAFHSEAMASILDGLQKGDAADTIFLELNGYRMSVDASQHAVRAAIVEALMRRVEQLMRGASSTPDDEEGITTGAEKTLALSAREAVRKVFGSYTSLLERVILDRTTTEIAQPTASETQKHDQIDFLLELQKQCSRWPLSPNLGANSSSSTATTKTEGPQLLLFAAKELYDLDLIEEEGVLQWWDDDRSVKMADVRGLTEQFVVFLREAEEDDSDDDEEEDDEDEEEG